MRKIKRTFLLLTIIISVGAGLAKFSGFDQKIKTLIPSDWKGTVSKLMPSKTSEVTIYSANLQEYTPPGGFPAFDIQNEFQIIDHKIFKIAYCDELYSPTLVAYPAIATNVRKSDPRPRGGRFFDDPGNKPNITHDDYTNSGYDRGHLFPNYLASVCYGPDAQALTFFTSNITPQTPELNRGIWRELEGLVGFEWRHNYQLIHVITGPIFKSKPTPRIKNKIAIPDGYFKILLRGQSQQWEALAFIFPQNPQSSKLSDYLVSIDTIEKITGWDFFSELPDTEEYTFETYKAKTLWP
jgi:endonuclease G